MGGPQKTRGHTVQSSLHSNDNWLAVVVWEHTNVQLLQHSLLAHLMST